LADYPTYRGRIELESLAGASYTLLRCRECGLLFQEGVAGERLQKKIYEQWIDPQVSLAKRQQGMDLYEYSELAKEVMILISLLGGRPGSLRVLDYGMGWGTWCLMAKAFACQSYGLEFSQPRLEFARANGIQTVTWEELGQGQFDYINCNQVLEHLAQPGPVLDRLAASLRPGGLIRLAAPNCAPLAGLEPDAAPGQGPLWEQTLRLMKPLEHVNGFTPRTLVGLAGRAGLRRFRVPLRLEYACTPNWLPLRKIPWKLWRPFYRSLLVATTNLVFQKQAQATGRA